MNVRPPRYEAAPHPYAGQSPRRVAAGLPGCRTGSAPSCRPRQPAVCSAATASQIPQPRRLEAGRGLSAAARRYGRQLRAPLVRAVRTMWDRASADRQPRRSAAWRWLPAATAATNVANRRSRSTSGGKPPIAGSSVTMPSSSAISGDAARRSARIPRQYCLQPGQPRRERRIGVEPRRIAQECDHWAKRAVRIEIGRREMHAHVSRRQPLWRGTAAPGATCRCRPRRSPPRYCRVLRRAGANAPPARGTRPRGRGIPSGGGGSARGWRAGQRPSPSTRQM